MIEFFHLFMHDPNTFGRTLLTLGLVAFFIWIIYVIHEY